jgi:hypothetical protein
MLCYQVGIIILHASCVFHKKSTGPPLSVSVLSNFWTLVETKSRTPGRGSAGNALPRWRTSDRIKDAGKCGSGQAYIMFGSEI